MRSRWGRTVLGCRSSVSAISAVASGRGRPGQLEVDGVAGVVAERLQDGRAGQRGASVTRRAYRRTEFTRACAGRIRRRGRIRPAHQRRRAAGSCAASSTPSWAATSSTSGMVRGADGRPTTARSPSPSRSPPPAARCGPRSSSDVRARVGSLPGVTDGEARLDRDDPDEKRAPPWPRPAATSPQRDEDTVGRPHRQGRRHRLGQGRRRQVVGHRQPGRRPRRPRASPSACSTPTSGASPCPACSASRAGSPAWRTTGARR